MTTIDERVLMHCDGCGERFPEPDDLALIDENSCEWHQLWEPDAGDVIAAAIDGKRPLVDGVDALGDLSAEEVVDGEVVPEMSVVPYTGEVLVLADMTFAQLGAILDGARTWERAQLRDFKRSLEEEILRRMDANAAAGVDGAWTVHQDGWKVSGSSPNQGVEYDVDTLRAALEQLVADGVIEQEAIDKVIVPDGYKVAKRPLGQLLKLGGTVRAAIEAVEQPANKTRRVSVSIEASR